MSTTPEQFLAAIEFKFHRALINSNRYRAEPLVVALRAETQADQMWLHFSGEGRTQSIVIPVPRQDAFGNTVLGQRVVRAVGSWCHKDGQGKWQEQGFWDLLSWLLCSRIEHVFPQVSKQPQLERLVHSFGGNNTALVFRGCQDLLDGLLNTLPLTGTPLETWAMCHRVVFLDPEFDGLTPAEKLTYQKELNKEFFPWSSLGLSDSGMVQNYLLKKDLRYLTPFGVKHHNPRRNLYQTLGMRGREAPLVVTKGAAQLAAQGIERRGWNWLTCFLELPLNFEDQLIVDSRHLAEFTLESRRVICFGEPRVAIGDELPEGAVLSVEPSGTEQRWWVRADNAVVVDVTQELVNFNGQPRKVQVISIETRHNFKEGIKLTNSHGNKGVVVFADCGTMLDAGHGVTRPIDIIVSARSLKSRRNYGQVLEALTTLLHQGKPQLVLPDELQVTEEQLRRALTKRGYAADGTSHVRTSWGEFETICGWLLWGLIKNPETQLWTKAETNSTGLRGLRTAGAKVSHIELKGLTTIFGPRNPVVREILQHQQGVDEVLDLLRSLEVMRGKVPRDVPLLDWTAVRPLAQAEGCFHAKAELTHSVADETLLPAGFLLQLPRTYRVFVPDNPREAIQEQLLSTDPANQPLAVDPLAGLNVLIDKIYVPAAGLRAAWEHPTGLWGLSDIGGLLNNIIVASHNLATTPQGENQLQRAIYRYFHSISHRLSTKRGDISTYCSAVRYPHTAKATATLAKEGLPRDWVEIHADMAQDLRVQTGDHVLVERYPCLGFKSLRIQRVRVTDDPQCRYVIRVSGNSLVSQNLDFDGDVLFILAFHSPQAKQALAQEFLVPDILRKRFLDEANNAKQPRSNPISLTGLGLETFAPLDQETVAEIVGSLTGLKRGTGTIVALAYNLMRIIESNVGYHDRDTNLGLEVILDKVANSVFCQKHVGEQGSLEERCKRAVCLADLPDMLAMGFPETASRHLCEIIRQEAASVGVTDLARHYQRHCARGSSNIINQIVRLKHQVYFATRSDLHPVQLLKHLEAPATDLVAHLWYRGLRKYTKEQPRG